MTSETEKDEKMSDQEIYYRFAQPVIIGHCRRQLHLFEIKPSGEVSKGGVYIILNVNDGKCYVGSTKSFKDRWYEHRCRLNRSVNPASRLQRAWNREGAANFKFLILDYSQDLSRGNLVKIEQKWLDALKASERVYGYNMAPNANDGTGLKHSEKTRAKISAAKKGKKRAPFTEQHRANMSLAHQGKRRSDETRAKISAAHRGVVFSDQHRANISAARKGIKPSDETRAKMRASRQAYLARKREQVANLNQHIRPRLNHA